MMRPGTILLASGLALSLLVPRRAHAQLVQGQVVAQRDKRPLPDIRVALLDDSAKIVREARSDSAGGYFYLEAPHPGHFQLAIFDRLENTFTSPAFDVDSTGTIERQLVLPELPAGYGELPVAPVKSMDPLPGWTVPRYPTGERTAQRSGVVRIAFIVDAEGRVEKGSEYLVAATNDRFADAVREAVRDFRFQPAAEAARPPRVITVRTVTFNLSTDRHAKFPCTDICITALGVRSTLP